MQWPTPEKKSLHPKALLGAKNSHGLLAMLGQSQNNGDSDRFMKNSGSPNRALRSYPQHLTSQATKSQDLLLRPASPSRKWHLEVPNQKVDPWGKPPWGRGICGMLVETRHTSCCFSESEQWTKSSRPI